MQKTRRGVLAAGLAGALPLIGLNRARGAAPDRLVMGISGWPATLAPFANAGTVAMNAKLLIFRGLLSYGVDGKMQGELAETWERDGDDAWIFRLREALFHNGRPVTSDDVRYSIEQMAGEKSTAYMKGEMQRISRIETPNARIIRLVTSEPSVVLPALLANYFTPMVARGSLDNGGPGIGACANTCRPFC